MKRILLIFILISTILITQVFGYSNEKVGDTTCTEIKKDLRYPNLSPILIGKIDEIGDRLNNKYKEKDEAYKERIYNLYIKVLNENITKTKYTERQKEILLRIGDYFVCKKEELKEVIETNKNISNNVSVDNNQVKPLLSDDEAIEKINNVNNTYYVKNDGNDNADGKTDATAWKTLEKLQNTKFSPGDRILFKRGNKWEGGFNISSSGIQSKPIVYGAYGIGDRPIITGFGDIKLVWTNQGNNKWVAPFSINTSRLYKDGAEQKRTSGIKFGHTWEEFGRVANRIRDNGRLYYYSTSDPSNSSFEGNKQYGVLYVNNKSYINIMGLDIRGGINHVIKISDSNNINVSYCTLGKQAGHGIVISNSEKLIIERNTFDSDNHLTFPGVESYKGVDDRGIHDGLVSRGGFTDSEIRYNDFKQWRHASISFIGASNNKIHHNFFTAPGLDYSRGISYSGDSTTNNEVYNNYTYKIAVRSQLNGKNNHVHHNWFKDITGSPMKTGELGQAIGLENYNGNPTGNIYEYNTFENINGPGIDLIASGDSSKNISGNTFRKNLFINNGINPYYGHLKNKGISIQHYVDIGSNNFYDNYLMNSSTKDTIYYRQSQITVEEFNAKNGNKGDKISGNTSKLSDQGAGKLDLSKIGVNGR